MSPAHESTPPTKRQRVSRQTDGQLHLLPSVFAVDLPQRIAPPAVKSSSSKSDPMADLTSAFRNLSLGPSSAIITITGKRKRALYEDDQPTAAERAFGITEILENILVYLPPKDILRSQSVSSAFRDCYTSSKQLQLKTFQRIHGLTPTITDTYHTDQWSLPIINPAVIKELRWDRPRVQGICHLYKPEGVRTFACTPAIVPRPCKAYVAFERAGKPWTIKHTASWTELFLYDTDEDFELVVHREYEDRLCVAEIKLQQCTIGKVVEVAQKLDEVMAGGYVDFLEDGEWLGVYLQRAQDWIEFIGEETLDLMVEEEIRFNMYRH